MKRTFVLMLVVCFSFVGVLAQLYAKGSAESGSQSHDPRPGTIIWAGGSDLSSADGDMWDIRGDNQIHDLYLESLVKDSGWDNFVPDLALSWKISPDDLTYTFQLRPGVKFSTGDPLTADDVVWSANRLKNMPTGDLRSHVADLVDAKALDPQTVRLTFDKPNPLRLYDISYIRVYSKAEAQRDGDKFYEKFIGTGPWKEVAWQPGSYIRFARNPGWWGKFAPNAPTTIEYRPIPEQSTRISALLSGEVDLVSQVPGESIQQVKDSDIATVVPKPFDEVVDIVMKNDRAPFNDSKLREAMDYMVPREKIVNQLVGEGTPAIVWTQPSYPWFPEQLKGKVKPFDLDKAKQLIAESGYKGQEIHLMTRQGRSPKDVDICQLLASIWNQAGLNVKVDIVSDSAYAQRRAAGNYDMFMTAWDFNSPAFYYGQKYDQHKIDRDLSDPKFKAMVQQLVNEADWDKFVADVKAIESYLYQDPAALHIYDVQEVWGVSKRITSLDTVPGYDYPVFETTTMAPEAVAQ